MIRWTEPGLQSTARRPADLFQCETPPYNELFLLKTHQFSTQLPRPICFILKRIWLMGDGD
jgi:hypothetical protein